MTPAPPRIQTPMDTGSRAFRDTLAPLLVGSTRAVYAPWTPVVSAGVIVDHLGQPLRTAAGELVAGVSFSQGRYHAEEGVVMQLERLLAQPGTSGRATEVLLLNTKLTCQPGDPSYRACASLMRAFADRHGLTARSQSYDFTTGSARSAYWEVRRGDGQHIYLVEEALPTSEAAAAELAARAASGHAGNPPPAVVDPRIRAAGLLAVGVVPLALGGYAGHVRDQRD